MTLFTSLSTAEKYPVSGNQSNLGGTEYIMVKIKLHSLMKTLYLVYSVKSPGVWIQLSYGVNGIYI